jgi:Transposase DDE domain group 1
MPSSQVLLDQVDIAFDDEYAVASAGLLLPATLAERLGIEQATDQVTGEVLTRAWAAGAGPGEGPLTVDVDSTICEVHGSHKQGAGYGYTHRLATTRCWPPGPTAAEVLHARLRKGSANTARGILRFCDELIARCRRAGASGELTFRMDAGFWSAKLIRRLRRHRVRSSITVRQTKTIRPRSRRSTKRPGWTSPTRLTGSPRSPRPPTGATG